MKKIIEYFGIFLGWIEKNGGYVLVAAFFVLFLTILAMPFFPEKIDNRVYTLQEKGIVPVCDKETGVEYLIFSHDKETIIPRYEANGSLKTCKKGK